MIADLLCNKEFESVTAELLIGREELEIYLLFITQCYFVVPNVKLNCFAIKIPNNHGLQQLTFNHPSDIKSIRNLLMNHVHF